MAATGGFENEQAMRAHVESLGPSAFIGDAVEVGELNPSIKMYQQNLMETHYDTAVEAMYRFYRTSDGKVWFVNQPYSRSALFIRPSYHNALGQ